MMAQRGAVRPAVKALVAVSQNPDTYLATRMAQMALGPEWRARKIGRMNRPICGARQGAGVVKPS